MIQELEKQQAIVKDLERKLLESPDHDSNLYNSWVAAQNRLKDMSRAYQELQRGKKIA